MRRKSERNKSKGSPEKKVEKATRKSTRKRGKRATSSSPEKEDMEGKSSLEVTKSEESVKELITQPATRLKVKELRNIVEEELSAKQVTSTASETVTGNEKVQDDVGEGASVWKVARADASPGEIQKLKLCRQRNPSEASDSSSSRKKSHKSYESGEGDAEEGDSAEELIKSRKNRDFARSEMMDDPSSSNPGAQDSREEVSHCSELLPRNTTSSSANFLFSDDDKQNLDRLAENNGQAFRLDQNNPVQKPKELDDTLITELGSNADNPADSKASEDFDVMIKKDEDKTTRKEEETSAVLEAVPSVDQVTQQKGEVKPLKESSSEEDRFKKSEPIGEANPQGTNLRAMSRNARRKHRSKYHVSSDSDTPESEDEPSEKQIDKRKPVEEEEDKGEKNTESAEPHSDDRLGGSAGEPKENKIIGMGEDRVGSSTDEKSAHDGTTSSKLTGYKPAKVNLKRFFSTRLVEAEEATRKEDAKKNGESEAPLQVKENNRVADENVDGKNLPRKRRWGTTVITEVVPAFTVSTDSLKALVPGAKPLSITEVRLSKDDDEEKARRKEREKRHSVSDDSAEKKSRDDGAATRIDGSKKGELKHDNHIGAKRKISILKETPRVKSPSPPSTKVTNVLLIKNLVRPFTLNQIKELLSRTGTIVENGFWIDGIKSKCYVVYANEDQAFETRQALHGISWPVSNPKRLQVEYATKEDMALAREQAKDQPVQRKAESSLGNDTWQHVWAREDKQNIAVKVTTVREWDLGKEDGHQVKDKEREKKDVEKKRRQRSRSPPVEQHLPPPARKFKKKEDEPPPAKLLDDLFKKTKAIPCIYWLPLTNEQIVVKEEMRRQHMAEHARRLEEMKRAERIRDPGSRRRRSPRK